MCDISSDAELHGLQSLRFAFWISSWLNTILCRKYDSDHSRSQKYSIWVFSIPSEDRVETWHMQLCRAHRTLSMRAWTDPVDQFLWRRIIRNSMRSILKIVSVGTVRPWISQVVPVLKQSPAQRSMQNWMGYNLMGEVLWKSFSHPDIWSKYWRTDEIGNDDQRVCFGPFDPISRCINNLMYPVL